MQIKTKKILIIFLIPILLATVGFGCKRSCSSGTGKVVKNEVTVTYWSLFTESASIDPLIRVFEAQNPQIKINYKNFGDDYVNYHREVIDALAAGRGPDIWSVHHTWLVRDKNLIAPCPENVMNINDFKASFVDAAIDDNIIDGVIYGIPFSLDTLALFYNQDLFNQAHIVSPPKDWEAFREDVQSLTLQDEKGKIIQAGTALGTGKNINRAPDIVALLMMQNGAQMTDANKTSAAFNAGRQDQSGKSYVPGKEALDFYTEFASPKKAVYTWNPLSHYSIDAFTEGTLATMFSYSFHLPTVKLKAPNLAFKVSSVPQIADSREVNFANYWTNVVSAKTKYQNEAWAFLAFMAKKENMQKFCEEAKRPPARRDLFNIFDNDPELAVFAHQILTAKSWPRKDNDAADNIFEDMIEDVILGKKTSAESLNFAAAQINQTMK